MIDFESIFNDAAEQGFGPSEDLTPGKYVGTIVSANWGKTKKGDPKAGFLFKAAEGSVSDAGEDVGGDTLWLNAYFSEAAKAYSARDLKSLGITGAMLNVDPEAAVQTAVGQTWSFTVKLSSDGEFTNLYLGKRKDGEEAAAAAPKPPKFVPVEAEDETDTVVDDPGEDVWNI